MPVILIELVLVLGVTLGIGLWQLYDVNKALKEDSGDDRNEAETAEDPGSTSDAGAEDDRNHGPD